MSVAHIMMEDEFIFILRCKTNQAQNAIRNGLFKFEFLVNLKDTIAF